MNWFKQHLNWTWIFSTLLQFAFISLEEPYFFIAARILWLITTVWVLHQKDRSWAWFFIPISVLFLSNNKTKNTAISNDQVVSEK